MHRRRVQHRGPRPATRHKRPLRAMCVMRTLQRRTTPTRNTCAMTTGRASIPARRIPLRSRPPRPYWLDSIDGPATTRRVPLNKLLTHPIRIKMLVNTLKRRRRTLPQRLTHLRLKRQPRNSSIRLSTQRMQRLNRAPLKLGMDLLTLLLYIGCNSSPTDRTSHLSESLNDV